MREYTNTITLANNSRGIWSLDPTIGCESGMKGNVNGCYNDCYAARYSKKYGYDFSKTVLRNFKNEQHIKSIVDKIRKIDMPFIRMGTSGDPSENWQHTINVIESISKNGQLSLFYEKKKEIVIITKHWNVLTDKQLKILSKYNICVNTSVSALDNPELLEKGLKQYERLKPYCKSILRVVSADFNEENKEGKNLSEIQRKIFLEYDVLDTVLRVSKNNKYATGEVINIKKSKFMGKKCYISKYNRKTYFGKCENCIEMCGLNIKK